MSFFKYFTTHGKAFSRVSVLITLVTAFVWLLILSMSEESVAVPTVFVGFGILMYLSRQWNKFKEL